MNPLFQRFRALERDERLEILKGLPKVELHRHLEGALRIGTMLELGRKHNLNLPLEDISSLLKLVAYNDGEPRTLAHFLTKFHSDWYRSYQDIERVACWLDLVTSRSSRLGRLKSGRNEKRTFDGF